MIKIEKIIGELGRYRAIIFMAIFCISLLAMFTQPTKVQLEIDGFPYDDVEDKNVFEVVRFMEENTISERRYSSTYNCYNFAVDTIRDAAYEGIRSAYVVIENPYENDYLHHAIIAFNCPDAGIVFFEPQDDTFVFLDKSDILYMQWCDDEEAWKS